MSTTDSIDDGPAIDLILDPPSTSSPPPPPSDASPDSRVSRTATKLVPAFETAEGVGARVKRSIGTPSLWNLSPFLILDWARVEPGGGFPDHPHRGMSTVTYVLEGMMEHEDFLGNRGRLTPGDVQWMTAGRGIVHSEMPVFDEDALSNPKAKPASVALQLWVDLPAGKKMVKPSYQEKKAAQLARAELPDGAGSVVVISGESHGAKGPVRPIAGCWFLDFRLNAGAKVWQPIPEGWTAFAYVLEGTLAVGAKVAEPHTCVVLSATGDGVELSKLSGRKETRVVLIAGEPLNQPAIMQGPFVVTSREAAVQALKDFQGGRNGFEKAPGWTSSIAKPVNTLKMGKKKRS